MQANQRKILVVQGPCALPTVPANADASSGRASFPAVAGGQPRATHAAAQGKQGLLLPGEPDTISSLHGTPSPSHSSGKSSPRSGPSHASVSSSASERLAAQGGRAETQCEPRHKNVHQPQHALAQDSVRSNGSAAGSWSTPRAGAVPTAHADDETKGATNSDSEAPRAIGTYESSLNDPAWTAAPVFSAATGSASREPRRSHRAARGSADSQEGGGAPPGKGGGSIGRSRNRAGGGRSRHRGSGSSNAAATTGRWCDHEHDTFVEGLRRYGRDWKQIHQIVPTRSVVQIRTHA